MAETEHPGPDARVGLGWPHHSEMDLVGHTDAYFTRLQAAADFVRARFGEPDIAIVLGSGLGAFDEILEDRQPPIPYDEVPFMPLPSVVGHSGRLSTGRLGSNKILCFSGRVHAYEAYFGFQLTFCARLAAMLGCKVLMLTNAAGGWMPGCVAGDVMIIRDHLNLHWQCPLRDLAGDKRFGDVGRIDSANLYSKRLAVLAQDIAKEIGMRLHEGVYCWSPGPSYETHSEVRALLTIGAQAFGMSTVPEVCAARAMGMEVFALSVITNIAAGLGDTPLSHSEVADVAQQSAAKTKLFIKSLMERTECLPVDKSTQGWRAPAKAIPLRPPTEVYKQRHQSEVTSIIEFLVMSRGIHTAVFYCSDKFASLFTDDKNAPEILLPTFIRLGAAGKRVPVSVGIVNNADGSTPDEDDPAIKRVLAVKLPLDDGIDDEDAYLLAFSMVKAGIIRVVNMVRAFDFEGKFVSCSVVTDAVAHTSGLGRWPQSSRLSVTNPPPVELVKTCADKGVELSTVSYFHYPMGPMLPTPAELKFAKEGAKVDCYGSASISPLLAFASLNADTTALAVPEPIDAPSLRALHAILAFHVEADRALHEQDDDEYEAKKSPESKLFKAPSMHSLRAAPVDTEPLTYEQAVEIAGQLKEKIGTSTTAMIVDSRLPLPKEIFEQEASVTLDEIVPGPSLPESSNLRFSKGRFQSHPDLSLTPLAGKQAHPVLVVRDGFITTEAPRNSHINRRHGRDMPFAVRLLKMLGVRRLIILTPVTSVDPTVVRGTVYTAQDHINMTGFSPLFGKNDPQFGVRFPDMTNSYDPKLKAVALDTPGVTEGVFALLQTCMCFPAEREMCRHLGAKVVADAGVPEALTALHASLPAVLLGVVSNAPPRFVPALEVPASQVSPSPRTPGSTDWCHNMYKAAETVVFSPE